MRVWGVAPTSVFGTVSTEPLLAEMVLDSVEKWRKKNADWLLSDSEADEVFTRDNQIEADVRHPEDFGL